MQDLSTKENKAKLLLHKLQTNYDYGKINVEAEIDLSNKSIIAELTSDGRNAINEGKLSREELIKYLGIACWNWALTGGKSKEGVYTAPSFLYGMEGIIRNGIDGDLSIEMPEDGLLRAIFSDKVELGKQAITNLKRFVQRNGSDLSTDAKIEFMQLGMKIAALANGLIPNDKDEASTFTLHMDTEAYNYSTWTHWGIGVKRLDGTRSIIQKLPGAIHQTTADSSGNKPEWFRVRENTKKMWQSPDCLTAVIGIEDFLPAHYDLLSKDHYEASRE